MNLTEFKSQEIAKNVQFLIFDKDGKVLESDEVLLKTKGSNFNVFHDTMFSGMEGAFAKLAMGAELKFDCIETDLMGRSSHYDFLIKRIPDEDDDIRFGWIIYDHGEQYQKIFELQQERNLAEIQYNRVEREATKLREEKDAIDKLYGELKEGGSSQYILVKSDSLLINLDLTEILYFEAYGDYIKVHTPNKMYVTYNTMKAVEVSLPRNQFFRIHRSYIVRLDKIKNIEQLSVEMGEKVLPIGKSYKTALVEKMGQL